MSALLNRRALLSGVAVLALAKVAISEGQPAPRVIRIVARKFEFVPDRIEVARGENVILELTAPDVAMGFNLADFSVRADVVPGQVARIALTADKAGRFEFVCDVFCGSGHEDMSGSLVVA
jgi:cytochrome c oxidase subunit 2